jgi:hypothetical protein
MHKYIPLFLQAVLGDYAKTYGFRESWGEIRQDLHKVAGRSIATVVTWAAHIQHGNRDVKRVDKSK